MSFWTGTVYKSYVGFQLHKNWPNQRQAKWFDVWVHTSCSGTLLWDVTLEELVSALVPVKDSPATLT